VTVSNEQFLFIIKNLFVIIVSQVILT